jgi:hypothetical protein
MHGKEGETEMIDDVLLFGAPGPIEIIILLVIFGIPVAVVFMVIRYISRSRSENIRLRLEVGKLANELEQARRGNEGTDTPQADQ